MAGEFVSPLADKEQRVFGGFTGTIKDIADAHKEFALHDAQQAVEQHENHPNQATGTAQVAEEWWKTGIEHQAQLETIKQQTIAESKIIDMQERLVDLAYQMTGMNQQFTKLAQEAAIIRQYLTQGDKRLFHPSGPIVASTPDVMTKATAIAHGQNPDTATSLTESLRQQDDIQQEIKSGH